MRSYRDTLILVKERRTLVRILRLADLFAVLLTVATYLAVLTVATLGDIWYAIRLLVTTGVPFIVVSVLRRLLNAPRPYELYSDIYETPPRSGRGASFPSRHVFSAFAIGTEIVFIYPAVGCAVLFLGVLIAVSRVLLGKHFPRDVIAGALVGVATSLIGMIIMNIV